ncbi:MAG: penicillin acylase family protein [Candidatus Lindowbacteria bacterium]|nr:penicillin acylase family protein [Candidatus Lindowbacteria bacterium]
MKRVATLVFAVCVAVGAIIIIHPARKNGTAEAVPAGKTYNVRILRDSWGVPHIFGQTDADVAYGLAYAHAEDDFRTIQDALLAARGQLASVYGRKSAPVDYMVHLLRVWDVVNAKYETDLSPETRTLCEAYAAGLTRYAAKSFRRRENPACSQLASAMERARRVVRGSSAQRRRMGHGWRSLPRGAHNSPWPQPKPRLGAHREQARPYRRLPP